ncbi:hypothetical protein I8H83_01000 [Candidatus Saccharibacteria bacterium]|nr:hypothetical protein [Candidatus Saccharibacteria bacterium]
MSNIREIPTALTREHNLQSAYNAKIEDIFSTFNARYPDYQSQAEIVRDNILFNLADYVNEFSVEEIEEIAQTALNQVLEGNQPEHNDSIESFASDHSTDKSVELGKIAASESTKNVIPLFR